MEGALTTRNTIHGLTPREYAFCLSMAKHNDRPRAVREAYGVHLKMHAVHQRGYRLMRKPLILSMIDKLRDPALLEGKLDLQAHLDNLRVVRDKALTDKNYRVALDAEVKRGEAANLYIQRSEVGKPGDFAAMTDEDLRKEIEANKKAHEELARINQNAKEVLDG